jgi:hypothetical protein
VLLLLLLLLLLLSGVVQDCRRRYLTVAHQYEQDCKDIRRVPCFQRAGHKTKEQLAVLR